MRENIFMECLILSGKRNIKNSYNIKFVNLTKFSLLILEFFVFLIIGRNNPKMYNKIITKETISIALTPFIFIKIIFLLTLEIIQQNYKVYD